MRTSTAIIPSGNILIRDGMIEAIWNSTDSPPSNVDITSLSIIQTDGIIFPGLIDSHNHLYYDTIPIWDVSKRYSNRYEWQEEPNYDSDIEYPSKILSRYYYANLLGAMVKYAEIKALIGGTTAIQGVGGCNNHYSSILTRNIELTNFGIDNIKTHVPNVQSLDATSLLWDYNLGKLDAFFLHIGEGTDELSHQEFETLKSKGLLIEPLVAIHALAFNRSDFAEMAAVGAKMVWSPTSNLLLYGDTADVQTASEEGVIIALAPDWSPSGAKNVLGELKIADQWNKKVLGGYFSDYALVKMVTSDAAKVCGWEHLVGQIKVGSYADLLVLDNWDDTLSPYRALINAIDHDVELVTIGGDPLYGLEEYLKVLKPGDYEVIEFGGWNRALDITMEGVTGGDQNFSWIETKLSDVMTFTPEVLYDNFNVGTKTLTEFTDWLDEEFPSGLHSIPLDPIYTYGDSSYFAAISSSENLNQKFTCDLNSYYSRSP